MNTYKYECEMVFMASTSVLYEVWHETFCKKGFIIYYNKQRIAKLSTGSLIGSNSLFV